FAQAVAEALAREDPSSFTTKLAKAARGGRLFIDYLRNGRGATAVAAYSTRARPGATVSAPLRWEELSPRTRPEQFTVRTMPRRLAGADPWKGFESGRR